MPSAEIQFQTKWWILNTPDDFFEAVKEIRADLGWNGGVDVWNDPQDASLDFWQMHLSPQNTSLEPKMAHKGNVVMSVAGNVQVFDTEAEWQAAYPGLTGD